VRRELLAGTVAAIVALAASAFGSFQLVDLVTSVPDAPRSCAAFGSVRCLGTLTAEDLIRPLRARGFECDDAETLCYLTMGASRYRVAVESTGGAASSYEVEARFDASLGPSQRALDLLSWFAQAPFGHDPLTAAAAGRWVLQQVRAHAHALATVNGYGYEVEASGNEFDVGLPACPPGADCIVPLHGYLRLAVDGGRSR
jgi:hypothetical protein